ncbi:hypothetical protein [Hymenobacter lucidus]|uniref:TonB-dependent receptor plug domain-containing protein n=1 Tax=Hymenobacter lucidus TaxID=2880930 RepID=A0ABS8AYL6_9BACT|nr:hypothetical protein [Hymenobacter lucidus]MCB2410864.1 hypothetical protein [Hymenobacter lucidus]
MSWHCFRLLWVLGFCSVALTSQAQETTFYSRPQAPTSDPIFVLNSTVIINGIVADFTAEDNQAITKMMVYKGPSSPGAQEIPSHLQNISPVGVIDITSPKRVRSQSFPQLGRQLGLRGPLRFAINGYPLNQTAVAALRIAPGAIGQIHIVRPTAEQPETRVDIWLVPPPKPDYSKYPPGTIFLR